MKAASHLSETAGAASIGSAMIVAMPPCQRCRRRKKPVVATRHGMRLSNKWRSINSDRERITARYLTRSSFQHGKRAPIAIIPEQPYQDRINNHAVSSSRTLEVARPWDLAPADPHFATRWRDPKYHRTRTSNARTSWRRPCPDRKRLLTNSDERIAHKVAVSSF